MKQILVFFILISITIPIYSQLCHYSCVSCIDDYYTHCLTCLDTSIQPQKIILYNNSTTGPCSSPTYSTVNPLGIFLLLISIVSASLLKSQYILYFVLTLQTFGLYSLVQAAYSYSLTTILSSFQYLMIFSIMQNPSKVPDSNFTSHSMYRLNDFLNTATFSINSPPILSLIIIVAALLIVFSLFRAFRGFGCKIITQNILNHIIVGLRTFLLLTIQQTVIIIYVGIRFDSLKGGDIFLIILYLCIIVYWMVDCNLHQLPYFRSSQLMNLCFFKRLILPVLIIVPFKYTYNLAIFIFGFSLIQLLLLTKTSATRRNYIYLLFELACQLLLGIFIIVDLGNNNQTQANAASIAATILLSMYCAVYSFEVIIAIKSKIMKAKVKNNQDQWDFKMDTCQKITALRDQDTLPDNQQPQNEITSEPRITINHSQNQHDGKVINILEQGKKKQKKFKVQGVQ